MTDKQSGEQPDLLTLAGRRVYREQVEGKSVDEEATAPAERVEPQGGVGGQILSGRPGAPMGTDEFEPAKPDAGVGSYENQRKG